jgi:hypothetical protein
MLGSDDFLHQLREYHRDLLWTNLSNLKYAQNAWLLRPIPRQYAPAADAPLWLAANGRATGYRGGQVPCRNEPARFDADGHILTTDEPDPQRPDRTVHREGWVQVSPYWAPDTQVKVCAFDAQETASVMQGRNSQTCDRVASNPACGCGPHLQWCQTPEVTQQLNDAFAEQTLRFLEAVVRDARPYTDVLLARDAEVNGPIAHYFRYQSMHGGGTVVSGPTQDFDVPDIQYAQTDQWEPVQRGALDSGVLTLPGYLLRFQSNRGRANRFYNAFLCQAFQAPPGGLPAADDECNREPDLTKRCGCAYCHQAVEPAAAHWGRWAEAGVLPLDPAQFPRENPRCAQANAANNPICKLFYLTEANDPREQPYLGQLRSYEFADEHPERAPNIEAGPAKIAQEAVDSGAFASCTTRKMWTWVMGRAPSDNEENTVAGLAADFESAHYDLRALVRELVTRPEYVQAGRFTGEEGQ